MKLIIEIVAATLLVFCITASSAAFAAGKIGRSADGLSCGYSVPANASPAARCAAIKRQCGGKFYANYCGSRMVAEPGWSEAQSGIAPSACKTAPDYAALHPGYTCLPERTADD